MMGTREALDLWLAETVWVTREGVDGMRYQPARPPKTVAPETEVAVSYVADEEEIAIWLGLGYIP